LWAELAHLPDLSSVNVEQNRCWDHGNAKKPKQRRSPVDPEVVVHLRSKERETCTSQRPEKSVGCDGTVCMPHVDVDNVVQPLQENHQDSPTDRDTGNDLRHPGDVWAAGPRKPEKSDWEDEGAEDHGWETFFWDDSSMLLHLASKSCFGDNTDFN